jgi:hypothetical protein
MLSLFFFKTNYYEKSYLLELVVLQPNACHAGRWWMAAIYRDGYPLVMGLDLSDRTGARYGSSPNGSDDPLASRSEVVYI